MCCICKFIVQHFFEAQAMFYFHILRALQKAILCSPGILSDVVDEPVHPDRLLSDRLSCSELEPEILGSEKENKLELKFPQERNSPSASEAVSISRNCDRTPDTIASCTSPLSDRSERQEEHIVKKEKYRSSYESNSKPSPRQR